MKPAATIPVQDWMISPETKAVMGVLNAGSAGPMALFVGGCVRNALLGIKVGDIDIATKLTPAQVVDRLGKTGVKTVPTGLSHGTVTAVSGGKPYEITTLRRDVETDGRRAVVAFSQDWAEDAQRRDFTMNTLLADDAGNVYDPTGQGITDLRAGRVVFVGEPAQRIAEDILRILRFFRFHALYGKGEPDPAALAACRDQAHKIPELSRERITQEFFRILSVDNSREILWIIFDNGILKDFNFPDNQLNLLNKDKNYTLAERLFLLAGLSVDNIRAMENLLLFPKALWREIEGLDKALKAGPYESEKAVKEALYYYGRAPVKTALRIQGRSEFYELAETWPIPVFPLKGTDLLKAGLAEGPDLGARLRQLERDWIAADFDHSILR